MTDLTKLANYHHSDKGTTADSKHGFTEIYDQFFSNFRNEKVNILEVGIYNGASLRMYYDYFPNAEVIIGADIQDLWQFQNDKIKLKVLDQSDADDLETFVEDSDIKFDIIIDDGSHHMKDQQITFYWLSKLLKDGGMYIIEDLHTSLAENGLHLYGKDLEIAEDKANTTLHYLTNKPLNSVYLTDEQNEELRQQFGNPQFADALRTAGWVADLQFDPASGEAKARSRCESSYGDCAREWGLGVGDAKRPVGV